jgi:hypothetical protein
LGLSDATDGSERRKALAADGRTAKAGAVLTEAEIGRFVADGFVAIRDAVQRHVMAACVDVVWAELGKLGVQRDNRETWTRPLVWIPCPEGGPFVEAGTSPVLWLAYDQLIGPDRWPPRQAVGGHIPCASPATRIPGTRDGTSQRHASGRQDVGQRALAHQRAAVAVPVHQCR